MNINQRTESKSHEHAADRLDVCSRAYANRAQADRMRSAKGSIHLCARANEIFPAIWSRSSQTEPTVIDSRHSTRADRPTQSLLLSSPRAARGSLSVHPNLGGARDTHTHSHARFQRLVKGKRSRGDIAPSPFVYYSTTKY